jgi:transposase-like protein
MNRRNFTLLDVAKMGVEECKKHLAVTRWGDTPTCPYCACKKCYTTATRYKCSKCRRLFTVTVGTIFHNSKISLDKWYLAIYYVTNNKKGISSYQLGRDLGIAQSTAWFMLHRIRYTLVENGVQDKLENITEIDETYVGGKNRNRHFNKKVKHSQGRSFKDKTPVFGMLERGGKVRAFKVTDTKRKTLMPIIKKNIKKGSRVMTDEYRVYSDLHLNYVHKKVNHNRGQYVVGNAHTNTIEGFWSLLKRGILGIYHNVSRKHLDMYVSEFTFRYNNRKKSVDSRMNTVLKSQKQLSYKKLVK